MASLFVAPHQSPTSAGANYPGSFFYFYEAGTTTLAEVYSDAARTVLHTNPVEADANGVFEPIWLDPSQSYRVQFKTSADALIYDVDPYVAIDNGEDVGASINGQEDEEAAHVPEIVPSRYRYAYGNLKRYTSNNGDGSTPITEAFQNMLESGALQCFLPAPASSWLIDGQITWVNGVSVISARGTSLTSEVGSGEWTFLFDTIPYGMGAAFKGFILNVSNSGARGIQLWQSRNVIIDECEVRGPSGIGGYGIEINGGDDGAGAGIYGSAHNVIGHNVLVYQMAAGVRLYTDNTTTPSDNTAFANRNFVGRVHANTCTEGLSIDRANTNFIQMSLQANTEGADIGQYAKNNTFDLQLESNTRPIVISVSADENLFAGNVQTSDFVDGAGAAVDPHSSTVVVGSQLFQVPLDVAVCSGGSLRVTNPYDTGPIRVDAWQAGQSLRFGQRIDAGTVVDLLELQYHSTTPIVRSMQKHLFDGEVELDGALNHDGSTVGFYGTTPISKASLDQQATTATTTRLRSELSALQNALSNLGLLTIT